MSNLHSSSHTQSLNSCFLSKSMGDGIKFKIDQNNKEHQQRDGECGIYTMFFIINMLKKQSFKAFKKRILDDETVAKYRDLWFN